jgi:uncharacterized protein DUF998
MARKTLLICGIASSILYLAMNVFVPSLWEGYSLASQTVSELSAIGAPTRPVWVPLGLLYTVLLAAFGCGVWASADRSRALRMVGALLIADGVLGVYWPPMHQRAVLAAGGGTITDTLHLVWAGATVLLMGLAIAFGAAAFGARFRLYSVVTIAILATFGVLTGLDSSGVAANLPTPWVGVWERLNIAAFMIWIVALATNLLRVTDTATAPVRVARAG